MNQKVAAVPLLSNDEIVALVRAREEVRAREKAEVAKAARLERIERAKMEAEAKREAETREWREALEAHSKAIPAALHRLAAQEYPDATLIEVVVSVTSPWYSISFKRAKIQHETVAAWVIKEPHGTNTNYGGVWLSSTGMLVSLQALRNQNGQEIFDQHRNAKDLKFFDFSHGMHGYTASTLNDLTGHINMLGGSLAVE